MARRQGRKGDYLAQDDYSGFTTYASKLNKDYWGAYAVNPLKRNLQEIASPLNDPQPVSLVRQQIYEQWPFTTFGFHVPIDVGLSNVLTNRNNMAIQVLSENQSSATGIGGMQVGSTFVVS